MKTRSISRLISVPLALCSTAGVAQSSNWRLQQSRTGSSVARLEYAGGPVRALEFACLNGKVALGVHPASATSLRSFPIVFMGEGASPVSISLPRMGAAMMFAGILPDSKVPDGLSGGWARVRVAAAGTPLTVSLDGAASTLANALKPCYAPPKTTFAAAAAQPGPSGTADPAPGDLPPVILGDLADFRASCAEPDPASGSGQTRGTAIIPRNLLQRVDFNGDGVQDYMLDISKLRCSRDTPYAGWHDLIIYTSLPGGAFAATLRTSDVGTYALVPGARPGLRLHQAENVEGDPIAEATIRMTSATQWTKTNFGIGNWRLTGLPAYPPELLALIDRWDKSCTDQGRRLVDVQSSIIDTFWESEKKPATPIDFNADGRRDYVIEPAYSCGVFSIWSPRLGDLLPDGSALIAMVSKPDGTYALQAVPGSISLLGNGDPAAVVRQGNRIVLSWPDDKAPPREGYFATIEISWIGVTQTRQRRSTKFAP